MKRSGRRKVVVTIDAMDRHCGDCLWVLTTGCGLFAKELKWPAVRGPAHWYRCAACLKAEAKAKGMSK